MYTHFLQTRSSAQKYVMSSFNVTLSRILYRSKTYYIIFYSYWHNKYNIFLHNCVEILFLLKLEQNVCDKKKCDSKNNLAGGRFSQDLEIKYFTDLVNF